MYSVYSPHKIVLWTQKAITCGTTWRPGNRPEETGLEKKGA